MRRPARILVGVGAVLGLLLVLLLVLPYLFRDRIAERVKLAVNERVNAHVDWRQVRLGLFRHFPNLTLTLDDLSAVGTGKFEGDTLALMPHFHVSLGLGSVIRTAMGGGPLEVRTVELDRPRLDLVKLADGTANWDIMKKDSTAAGASSSRSVDVSLQQLAINDANVRMDNRQAGLLAIVRGYDQTLSGDFSRQNVAVRTKADADSVSVTFAGVPYLNQVHLALDADAQADLASKAYTLKRTELRLNDLALALSGSAKEAGENMALDLAFNAPSTDFRSILSLVPAVYAHDFDKVKTTGQVKVAGTVKGDYGDRAFPSFDVTANVANAAFQYPDLPLPARDINLDLALTNPGGSADSTVVTLDRFHVRLGDNPVDARIVLRTPVSDPDVNARVKGRVDLADVRRTVKLEGVDQLSGTVAADAAFRTRKSWVDRKQYDQISASGNAQVAGLTVKGASLPHPMAIQEASVTFAPQHAQLKSFRGTVGSSDIEASGTLENMLAYAFREDTLRGAVTVRSDKFNLDEWRSKEADKSVVVVPARIDMSLDAAAKTVTYGQLTMNDARGKLRVKDRAVTLEQFQMNTLGGQFVLDGLYETRDTTTPRFDAGVKMVSVNIPAAFKALNTVQALAPIAKYAVGDFSATFRLNGVLGKDMMPLFKTLSGGGTLATSQVAIKGFPALEKLVDVTKLQFLSNPTLQAFKANFDVRDGRFAVKPFDVKVAGTTLTVAGSNGFDQSLNYSLGLKVPRSLLGGDANQAISGLLSKAGAAGFDVGSAAQIPLAVQVGGTVTNPSVSVDVGSLAKGAQQALTSAVTGKLSAEAMKLIQVAESQAAGVRSKAQSLADKLKVEGYQQADSLTAKAGGNPLKATAASLAASQLRKQTDQRAADIISQATAQADSIVASARRQAEQLGGGAPAEGKVATETPDSSPARR